MQRQPPRKLSKEQKQAAENFIKGAEEPPVAGDAEEAPSRETDKRPPWKEPHVRQDVTKRYPLRLPEPLYLKLKYISQKTGRSMNSLCKGAVRELVEEMLADMPDGQ